MDGGRVRQTYSTSADRKDEGVEKLTSVLAQEFLDNAISLDVVAAPPVAGSPGLAVATKPDLLGVAAVAL